MSQQEQQSNIIIELNDSRDAKSFNQANLVHRLEFERAMRWIREQTNVAREETFSPKYNTITILGSRGSGKTTFMKSLIEQCDPQVKAVDIIDPTLIEEKGHPFLIILSEISRLVDEKIKKEDVYPGRKGYADKTSWENSLKKLAEGLPSLETIGSNYDHWQDAEYVMEKGLSRVGAARSLAQDFHNLLRKALGILGKKVFLIALDDIDVDFLKGWPVLETLRKYLATPLVITLLSGDLRLYSQAIRKHQWKNFGKALLKNEGEGLELMGKYESLVTEMEGQYMQKVLPPSTRIHLTTLQEKRLKPGGIGHIKVASTEASMPNASAGAKAIEELYRGYLKKLGIQNRSQQEPYLSFLLGLPLRSQIRLLTALSEQDASEVESWTDVFLSELYALQIDIDLLRSTPIYTSMVMLLFLQKQRILTRSYQFQPTLQDPIINTGLFALSSTFSIYSRENPFLFFDYLIRIGLPYSISKGNLLSKMGTGQKTSEADEIQNLIDYAMLTQERGLTNSTGDIIAYVQGYSRRPEPMGILPLFALASVSKRNQESSKNRIDKVLEKESALLTALAYLPLSVSVSPWKQESSLSASFYRLLAAIGELLKEASLLRISHSQEDSSQDAEGAEEKLYRILLDLGQLRSYTMPAEPQNASRDVAPYMEEGNQKESDRTEEDTSFMKAMLAWIKVAPQTPLSPHLLGQISVRLQRGVAYIAEEKHLNLGEAMHRYIVLFFNAVLVEFVQEESLAGAPKLNLNNAISGDGMLTENLKQIADKLPVFPRWLLACPIFHFFLSRKLFNEAINQYVSQEIPGTLSRYESLEKVDIKREKGSSTKGRSNEPVTYVGDEVVIDMTNGKQVKRNRAQVYLRTQFHSITITDLDSIKSIPGVDWGKVYVQQKHKEDYLKFHQERMGQES